MLNEVFSSGTELAERKHPAWTSLVFALSACDTAGIDPAQLGLLKVYVGITPRQHRGRCQAGAGPFGQRMPIWLPPISSRFCVLPSKLVNWFHENHT